MRIPLLVTIPLLAALAGLGWHNQQRIGELRSTQARLTASIASQGGSLDPAVPAGPVRFSKGPRPDLAAEAKQVAAGLVAYAAEHRTPEGTDPEVNSRRVLEETERVQSLNGSQLKILIAELQSAVAMEAKTRTSFIRFAIAQLNKTDPQSALAVLLETPELDPPNYGYQSAQHLTTDAIRGWAKLDPRAAQNWLGKNRDKLGERHAAAIQDALNDVAMSGDPLLALQLLSESGQELRGLSTLIDRSKLSPEKRLAFLAAWREWSATRPDFPAPPQAAQTVQDPDPFGHPVAKPVPGKEGFVLSPFNNQLIDVRGMRSGSLVSDSSAPPTEKWIFRVP
jgi:hypothetical protein